MQKQVTKLDFTDKDIFVGIDTHKKSWNITVMMGVYSKTYNAPPSAEALRKYLEMNFPGGNYYSAYEAGFAGFWPHYQLLEYGIHSIVVNAADIPTTVKEKIQKTDARDSRKIAKSLQNKNLTAIYVPSKICLNDRSLNRYRGTVSKDLSRIKNRIKSFLNLNGLNIPKDISEKRWPKRLITWLKELELEPSLRLTLNGHLEDYDRLTQKKANINKQVELLSRTPRYHKDAELFQSIPGIGLITAMSFLTELEDINRFKSFDQLCSFVGLVPSTRSSGEKDKIGEITPRAQAILRPTLIEASWTAIRRDPALASKYTELCHKGLMPNKAIIRIARKLLRRMRSVLKNRSVYEFNVINHSIKQPVQ